MPRYKSEEILFVLDTVEWTRDRDVRDALRQKHGVGNGQLAQQLLWPSPNWFDRAVRELETEGLVETRERRDPTVVGYQGYRELRLTTAGLTVRVQPFASPAPKRRLTLRRA